MGRDGNTGDKYAENQEKSPGRGRGFSIHPQGCAGLLEVHATHAAARHRGMPVILLLQQSLTLPSATGEVTRLAVALNLTYMSPYRLPTLNLT